MTKVLLLGCGYLGYNLYEMLKDSYDISIIGIPSPYTDRLDRFTVIDAFDRDAMASVDFRDAIVVDCIGLIANNARSTDEEAVMQSLERKYLGLFESLKQGGARRLVYFSSGGTIYGPSPDPVPETAAINPLTLYSRSKARVEDVLKGSGLDYLILRIANPFGGYQEPAKRQGVIPILIRKSFLQEPFEMWADGESVRDYLYIRDFAEALKLLAQNDVSNETVNVGSGVGRTLNYVIETVEQHTGKKIEVRRMKSDVPTVESIVLDISKLVSLTGYSPRISFEEGVRLETERIREEIGL